MPAYISVEDNRKIPTCKDPSCDQKEHWVNVQIGPAILDPFEELLTCMVEAHEDAMTAEGITTKTPAWNMKRHHREEPKCSYCAAIARAIKTIKAVKGKNL